MPASTAKWRSSSAGDRRGVAIERRSHHGSGGGGRSVPRPSRRTLASIIAGYHWFADWGRDTMIALPGLTLTTGRRQMARDILRRVRRVHRPGHAAEPLPRRRSRRPSTTPSMPRCGTSRRSARWTNRTSCARNLYGKLKEIVGWFERGSRYGIRVDSDGLLLAGEPGVQLTWMDAKVGDWVVTPRIGKPVEMQALWYNALRIMEDLARAVRRHAGGGPLRETGRRRGRQLRAICSGIEDDNCLYDVIGRDGARDASLRPNQIFAVSLPYSMLTADQARQRGGHSGAGIVHAWRPAQPLAARSRLLRALRRRSAQPRQRLSPGHGLALADGSVHHGIPENAWRAKAVRRRRPGCAGSAAT